MIDARELEIGKKYLRREVDSSRDYAFTVLETDPSDRRRYRVQILPYEGYSTTALQKSIRGVILWVRFSSKMGMWIEPFYPNYAIEVV